MQIPDKPWFWPAEVGRLLTPPVDRRTIIKLCDGLGLPYARSPLTRYARIPRQTVLRLLHAQHPHSGAS